MLDWLRSAANGIFAKVLLGVLALSFVVWGLPDLLKSTKSDVVAKVGSEEITLPLYQQAFAQEVRTLGERLGIPLSSEQAYGLGLDRQALNHLLTLKTFALEGKHLNIDFSFPLVAEKIAQQPQFQGIDGRFSPQYLDYFLKQTGMRQQDLLETERERLLGKLILSPITQSVHISPLSTRLAFAQKNEQRDLIFFELTSKDITPPIIQDTALKTFYEQNKQKFMTQERRTAEVLVLTPEVLEPQVSVSKPEIEKYYTDHRGAYQEPETREIQELTFSSLLEAKKAQDRLRSGIAFETLLKEQLARSSMLAGAPSPSFKAGEMADPQLEKMVFALKLHAVSAPVVGRLSKESDLHAMIVRVTKITPAHPKPLAQVEDQISRTLKDQKVQDKLNEIRTAVEDARGQGLALRMIAQKYNLPFASAQHIDREGKNQTGQLFKLPVTEPFAPSILEAIFSQDAQTEADPVSLDDEGVAWVNVEDILPPRLQSFEEAKDQVTALLREKLSKEALFKKGALLQERAQKGETLNAIAQSLKLPLKTLARVTRFKTDAGWDLESLHQIFSAPQQQIVLLSLPSQNRVQLVQTVRVFTPKFYPENEEAKNLQTSLSEGLSNDLSTTYLAEIQKHYGVWMNTPLLSSLQKKNAQ